MPSLWLKFGDYRLNLAQIGYVRRDDDVLRFYNVDGEEFFARQFESDRRARRVLDELFKFDDVRVLRSHYEGSEPQPDADDDSD